MAEPKEPGSGYAGAGVHLEAAGEVVARIRRLVGGASDPAHAIGSFAGAYPLSDQTTLLAGADGVGTKVLIAQAMGSARTVGIDLVAMNVNDVLAAGGRPLFFLDYIALGEMDPALVEDLVAGMVAGLAEAGAVLLGGETAEMPGLYRPGEYDLAGFAVGIRTHEPVPPAVGDQVIGIVSRGFHANGYSLVRKIVREAELDLTRSYPATEGVTLGEALLTPTPIYVSPVLAALERFGASVRTMAHITGGGLVENLPRALLPGQGVLLERNAWPRPALFAWFQELGGLHEEEMVHTFNGGIGFCLVVDPDCAEGVLEALTAAGERALRIGEVVVGEGVSFR